MSRGQSPRTFLGFLGAVGSNIPSLLVLADFYLMFNTLLITTVECGRIRGINKEIN